MKKPLIYLLLISLLFLFSCTEEIFDIKTTYEQKLAVSCLFSADSSFTVFIAHTKNMTDTSTNLFVDNATVIISDDKGNSETLTQTEQGKYQGIDLIAQTQTRYTINVSHPDFENVQASDSIPVPEHIINARLFFMAGEIIDQGHFKSDLLIYNFTNNPEIKQYFEIYTVGKGDTAFKYDHITSTWYAFFEPARLGMKYLCRNPLIDAEDYELHNFQTLVFSDRGIKDEIIELEISSYAPDKDEGRVFNIIPNVNPDFVLNTVSNNYYKYKTSLYKQIENEYYRNAVAFEVFMNFVYTSSNIDIFTNIENGYGIFAGYSYDRVEVAWE